MRRFYPMIIGFLLLGFFLSAFNTYAYNRQTTGPIWLSLSGSDTEGASPQAVVNQIEGNFLEVTITFPGIWAEGQTQNGEPFTRIWHDDFGSYHDPGKPALPGKAFNVLVPNGVQVEVINETFSSKTFELSQYALPKKILPAQIQAAKSEPAPPWTDPDPKQYGSRDPFPQTWFELIDTFRMRDYTIQPIWVNPVRYIAPDGEVELLEKLSLRLSWQENTLDGVQNTVVSDSPSFDRLVSQIVINPPEPAMYDTKSETREGYLIITPDEFELALTDFVTMKESQGYDVEVKKLSEITGYDSPADGENDDITAVQNYIRSLVPPPVYLLLVGDTNWIPAPSGIKISQKTDLYYSTLDGETDFTPDIFVGRLPVLSEEDLTNLVNKLVNYYSEGFQNYHLNTSFIATCDTSIHSVAKIPNFQIAESSHNHVIANHTSLLNYPGDFPEDLSPVGGDQLYCITHDAETGDITPRINDGRGLITYSGHGSVTGWVDGEIMITSSNIPTITTENNFSFISSFACYTNDFGNNQYSSFGETWMHQQNKGTIGFIGSAAPSYWLQDNLLEINMFDHLYSDPLNPPSVRESINVGLLTIEENYFNQDDGGFQYYLEAYNLLGDPSQKLWLYPDDQYFFIAQISENEKSGSIGSTVEYPINLTNYGDPDTFSVQIMNNVWETYVSDFGEVPTKTTLPLVVSVKIPSNAIPNQSDQVQITISTQNSDQIYSFVLTTTALETFFTHLPLIVK